MGIDLDELNKNIIAHILQAVPKETFIIRRHPSHPYNSVFEKTKLKVDDGRSMWETSCALNGISKKHVLICFSSTALVIPKFLFDKEPIVICLYPLLNWRDKRRRGETDGFFKMIKNSYREPERFLIVDNLKDLVNLLRQLV